ncbi:MAG TPA: hypothetical protein VKF82_07390 [Candidatus Eremiobacteraceae bacterium]|nr:hypothetical protein [Candidatus Eremiobacteraceae bacterium]
MVSAMPQQFSFSLDENWSQNLERLKAHLEALDPECAKMLFDNLATLQSDDTNTRRDFNQKVFEPMTTAAQAEIDGRAE